MIKSLFDDDDKEAEEETVVPKKKTDSPADAGEDSSPAGPSAPSSPDTTGNSVDTGSAVDNTTIVKDSDKSSENFLELPEEYDLEQQIALIEADLENPKTPTDSESTTPGNTVEVQIADVRQDIKTPFDETPNSKRDSPPGNFQEPGIAPKDYVPDSPAETLRKTGMAYSAAIALFGSVVFMLIMGWFADLLLGIRPWGTVIGIVIGAVIGFMQFFRITSKIISPKPSDFERVSIKGQEIDMETADTGGEQPAAGGSGSDNSSSEISREKPNQII